MVFFYVVMISNIAEWTIILFLLISINLVRRCGKRDIKVIVRIFPNPLDVGKYFEVLAEIGSTVDYFNKNRSTWK